MATKKAIPQPVQGFQPTFDFDEMFDAEVEKHQQPIGRVARASAILDVIKHINARNIKFGALGLFGDAGSSFDFDRAYGARVNREGKRLNGKTYAEVTAESAREDVLAQVAAERACTVCEFEFDCPIKDKLLKSIGSPEHAADRTRLKSRMLAVVRENGAKTMSCATAIGSFRPTKADWKWLDQS